MTEQDVFDMAREVCGKWPSFMSNPNLQAFAKLVAAKEREACAKVAIGYDSEPWKHTPAYSHVADMVSVEIGKAIRARGET